MDLQTPGNFLIGASWKQASGRAESPYSAPSDLEGDIHEFLLRKDKEIEKLIGLHSPVRLH